MGDLDEVIASIRARIEQHAGKGIGEQNTKAVLINPLLKALGWDLEDLDEVSLEYKRKAMDNPVDYALKLQRNPRIFIEAKPLDGIVADPKWAGQIMGYAAVSGVEWVILTNGNEYRIYNAHAAVPVEQKLFRSINLVDELDPAETLSLLAKERVENNLIGSLWKAHFIDKQVREAFEHLLQPEPSTALVRLIRKLTPDLAPSEVKAGLGRMQLQFDFPAPPSPPLAGLPKPKAGGASPRKSEAPGTPWRGVTLTDVLAASLVNVPAQLRKKYKGHLLVGRIEADGKVSFGGKRYDSLSTAAGIARASVIGAPAGRKYPQTNGWTFWEFEDSAGVWRELDELRKQLYKAPPSA